MNLENKVALVTGGSRGIGRAIALKLASQGAAVAVNYRSGQSEAESVVREITELGGKAISVQADVADIEAVRGLVETAVGQLGGLHLLVNNAGIARDRLVMEMEPNDWLDVMLVNFGGVFNCTRAVLPRFITPPPRRRSPPSPAAVRSRWERSGFASTLCCRGLYPQSWSVAPTPRSRSSSAASARSGD